ncbi:MAG: hotdog fold thioesterase [Microscillaceae bacterium]|nr:hotdog fold thioesterase [Microscillaceae bacterium]
MLSEKITLEALQHNAKGTITEHLGIEFTEVGEDFLCARMPVDHRTRQPYGILHGGASVVLAETLGSIGAAFSVDLGRYRTVGLDINANHIRPVREGYVYGKASPLHIGQTTHVWQIIITNEEGKLVNISRLTMAVIEIEKLK